MAKQYEDFRKQLTTRDEYKYKRQSKTFLWMNKIEALQELHNQPKEISYPLIWKFSIDKKNKTRITNPRRQRKAMATRDPRRTISSHRKKMGSHENGRRDQEKTSRVEKSRQDADGYRNSIPIRNAKREEKSQTS